MTDFLVVFVTVGGEEQARSMARTLVEEKLAACVNVLNGVQSYFSWEGKVDEASEALLMIKTRRDCFSRLSKRVEALHTYDVCEVIAFDMVDGNPSYLEWMTKSLS